MRERHVCVCVCVWRGWVKGVWRACVCACLSTSGCCWGLGNSLGAGWLSLCCCVFSNHGRTNVTLRSNNSSSRRRRRRRRRSGRTDGRTPAPIETNSFRLGVRVRPTQAPSLTSTRLASHRTFRHLYFEKEEGLWIFPTSAHPRPPFTLLLFISLAWCCSS